MNEPTPRGLLALARDYLTRAENATGPEHAHLTRLGNSYHRLGNLLSDHPDQATHVVHLANLLARAATAGPADPRSGQAQDLVAVVNGHINLTYSELAPRTAPLQPWSPPPRPTASRFRVGGTPAAGSTAELA